MAQLNDIQLRIIVQGIGIDNLNALNSRLNGAAGALRNAGDAAKKSASGWTTFADGLSNLERRMDAIFRAASHLQALGHDLTNMGKTMGGWLVKSVDQWGDYEFAIHRAAGALGIFDTKLPIFKALQQGVNDVAREARLFPAEEIARAVYYWGSTTGQTVRTHKDLKTVISGLIPLMQVAAVTEYDYQKAIKGVYQITQQYGLSLKRVPDITEKLMLLTQRTSLEFGDLIEAFKYTGTIAPALGVKFEDLAKVMAYVGDLGIRGSMSGRAFGQMFTKLVAPTAQAKKSLDEVFKAQFGVNQNFEKMVFPKGKFIGITKYLDLMARATENMTDKERQNLVAIMTTQNEMRVMVPLLESVIDARKRGVNALEDEKYSLKGSAEIFKQTTELLRKSWKGTMGLIENTIGPVVRLIGAEVARIATPILEWFGKILVKLQKFLDMHPEIVEWGVRIAGVAAAVLILAGAFFTAIGVLLAFGAGFYFVFKGFALFFGIFNRFLPILGAVTLAIGALVSIWVNNFGGLRDALINVWNALKNVFDALNFDAAGSGSGILSRLGDAILPILEKAAEAAAWMLNRIADALNWVAKNDTAIVVLQGLLNIIMGIMAISFVSRMTAIGLSILSLGKFALNGTSSMRVLLEQLIKIGSFGGLRHPIQSFKDLYAAIQLAAAGAVSKGKNIVDAIKGIPSAASSLPSTVGSAFSGMAAVIGTVSRAISTSIKGILIASGIGLIIVAAVTLYEAWTNNWFGIQQIVGNAVNWIVTKFNEFIAFLGSIWTNVTTTIRDAINNIVTFVVGLPGRILDGIVGGFNTLMKWIGDWWGSLGDNTAERIGGLVASILLFPVIILKGLIPLFLDIWNMIAKWFGELISAAARWVSQVVTAIIDWFAKLPGRIAGFFASVWNNLVTWWGQAIPAVGKWAGDTITGIIDWFSKLPGRIANFFSTLWSNLSTWFADLIPKAAKWAGEVIEGIVDWFRDLPKLALDTLITFPAKLSRFLKEIPGIIWNALLGIGEAIVNGIKQGLSAAWSTLTGWMGDAWNGFVNQAKNILGISSPSRIFAGIGVNVMEGMAQGIATNRSAIDEMYSQVTELKRAAGEMNTSMGSFGKSEYGYEFDTIRRIELDVKVSSPDGTVNNASQGQIREIFTTEDFVSSLEHMATVG